jgi:hypothetical protein
MTNILSLSIEEQNSFNPQLFIQSFNDNKQYAEGNIADHFIAEFESSPESFDFAFEYSYDEVSSKAKESRKTILILMLVSEGYIPTENV